MVKVKKARGNAAKETLKSAKKELNKVKKSAILSKVTKKAKDTTRKKTKKEYKRDAYLRKLVRDRGVVYIQHIPHGFYEKEMYDYFKQFGTVTAIKLPRSKNGNIKGYAFIEFEFKEIAKVVADTMNNYLMFDKLLKTEYIPPEKQKPHMFHRVGMPWEDTTFKEAVEKRRELDMVKKNNPKYSGPEFAKKAEKKLKQLHKTLLKKTGIDYEFQVDDFSNDTVELLSVKPAPEEPVKSNAKSNKSNAVQQLPVLEIDKSDTEIRLKPLPNVITRFINTSKSKLKTVKSKTNVVKDRLKTEVTTNKKVKELKSNMKKVKSDLKNKVITKSKNVKIKKAVTSKKPGKNSSAVKLKNKVKKITKKAK